MKPRCNKTCDVRHIYHKICTAGICDLTEFSKIDGSCICACPCDNKTWFVCHCKFHNIIIIDEPVIINAVRHDIKICS